MVRVSSENKVRCQLRQQTAWGRFALLLMAAVTLFNQLLLAFDVEYHLLFSAAVPYYLGWVCRQLAVPSPYLAAAVTAVLCGAYLVCWVLSARRRHWLAVALGLYAVDTLLLIFFALTLLKNAQSCLLEILAHGTCIVSLIIAIHAAGRLSRMPRHRRSARSHIQKEGTYDKFQQRT